MYNNNKMFVCNGWHKIIYLVPTSTCFMHVWFFTDWQLVVRTGSKQLVVNQLRAQLRDFCNVIG